VIPDLSRLPDRYPGQLKVPMSLEVEEDRGEQEEISIPANSKVFNHNMNLQTALIINTLSKVNLNLRRNFCYSKQLHHHLFEIMSLLLFVHMMCNFLFLQQATNSRNLCYKHYQLHY
jgi:hypothetical protein